ncbi:hypothetical protein Tco_0105906 [Tanacetum coccineum]
MEQMTTLRDLVDQVIQKKEEEKRIAEEQAAKDRSWKIPICYDDDEDNTIAITPVLPIEEPDNSLSMGDEHLDTIPATESDEVIKSSVEDLVPIPSESEIVVNSDDDNSSSDDDSYENIDYVDASPPDDEIVGLEVIRLFLMLSNDKFPPADKEVTFNHEELRREELAHKSISLNPEYDHFCFKIEPELGHLLWRCDSGFEDSRACSIPQEFHILIFHFDFGNQ